jgi:hypothetical protein
VTTKKLMLDRYTGGGEGGSVEGEKEVMYF